MAVRKILSGGHTGAEWAGLQVARAVGLETGGWAFKGWITGRGADPSLATFGLKETWKPGYPAQVDANVREADGTLWFGTVGAPGYLTTSEACRRHAKPFLVVDLGRTSTTHVIMWLSAFHLEVINVSGSREEASPGIAEKVATFLNAVLVRTS